MTSQVWHGLLGNAHLFKLLAFPIISPHVANGVVCSVSMCQCLNSTRVSEQAKY